MQSLKYPVLIYNERFIQGQTQSKYQLCGRTIGSFEKKIYEGLIIIDSGCAVYNVLSYNKSNNYKTIIVNIVDLFADVFSRKRDDYITWIDFKLSEPEQLTFPEVKNRIAALINRHPRWYRKTYEEFPTIEEKLDNYESIEDLIIKFAGYP